MSGQRISAAAAGPTGSIKLPSSFQTWLGAMGQSLLLNFSGGGPAIANVTVQVSNDPSASPQNSQAVQNAARWNAHDILQNMTGDKNSSIVYAVAFVRLLVNSYTSGTVTLDVGSPDTGYP